MLCLCASKLNYVFIIGYAHCSGVFSTGAMGAIAPVILRKRLIAPVILHMPYSVITYIKERQGWQVITVLLQSFEEGKLIMD